MKTVIRRGTAKDIPFLVHIEKECFAQPWSEKSFEDFFRSECSFLLVAEVSGKPCGYVGMYIVCGEGEITNLAVLSDYRRYGIGSSLIEELCKTAGVSRLNLEVRESNAGARLLYEKMGFKVDGRRKNFYEKPREDAILMSKNLTDMKEL